VRYLFFLILAIHVFLVLNAPPFNRHEEPYIPPPKAAVHLTSGFNVQFADSLWLRAVQDFDYCSRKISENECVGKSWLFSVLDLASTMDPKLEPSMYQTGGLALTVIISDYQGATAFFDRGVRIYPTNWQLNYAAAYHALFEEKDKIKASRLYMRAAENGAPWWVPQLAARLAEEGGDSIFAEKILEDMIAQNAETTVVERLKEKLKRIRSKK
jgi:hypothetical protein